MNLRLDYNNVMCYSIGKNGINPKIFPRFEQKIVEAYKSVMENRGKGWQEWCRLPYQDANEIDEMISYCEQIRNNAESFVVFGIGGSALGPLSVATALTHLRHNELPKKKRTAPKFYVEDNVDPERMKALLDVINLKKSYFNVVTKSGETSETLSQFLILESLLKRKLGEEETKKRIIVTTTIGKGTLYEVAMKEGYKVYGIGAGVGGRFSVLSAVGLVPFAVLGIDIKAMLKGAQTMSMASENINIKENPALMSAFIQFYFAVHKDCNISVMMPYADSLKYMSDFYCQIWGESLGKAVDLDGNLVNVGQTPVKALGVTDQHSQVQLYTEGPYDKVITFLAVNSYRTKVAIPKNSEINACDFLKGHTLNELIQAERKATAFALKKAGRPNFTIILPTVNAETIGELLMYFMYETAFAGALFNVDTFNQPGVEEGKKATFAMLKREGYEAKLKEIRASLQKKDFIM